MTRWIASAGIAALLSACGHVGTPSGGSGAPPLDVEIHVGGLKPDDQAGLEKQMCGLGGVVDCKASKRGRDAVFTLKYQGTLSSLQGQIASFPHPGLEGREARAVLRYDGFDNLPPEIDIISPKGGTLTETEQDVVIAVPDSDVKLVEANATRARRIQPGLYQARVQLAEGPNRIVAVAEDDEGNRSEVSVSVEVDTTPPEVDATVKIVVEGTIEPGSTVFVDGQQVAVNPFGSWRAELQVRPGQKSVEVVAIDKNGNKQVETRSLFGGGS